ncbi:MAG: hypothetical protein GX859_03655 [Corynebacterium humireducens]|jgi:hypothetical protein|uniref:Ribbon-helix-helix protein CopG domain-containing protein n=2 Tax=Corynebacterium humireducens TaxID=1223514 RepID=A0A0B5D498_9CORY|nr:hypothetical protein [Corynebacterium humireducens]AJE33681.1 hypothetical protein B842_09160 [Corynebacterium humireducens NBRC 106098 = DSM 45392]NLA55383.1 hypothetical protein [Corynebacterium humireducens]
MDIALSETHQAQLEMLALESGRSQDQVVAELIRREWERYSARQAVCTASDNIAAAREVVEKQLREIHRGE